MAINKINVRSPFFVEISEANLTKAVIEIYIYGELQTTSRGAVTFTLIQNAVNNEVTFEISDLIAGYLNLDLTYFLVGSIWVDYQITRYISGVAQPKDAFHQFLAIAGYGYLKDGLNPTNIGSFSNAKFYRPKDGFVKVPLFVDSDTRIVFKRRGVTLKDSTILTSNFNQAIPIESTNALFVNSTNYFNDFENRVIADGGVVENRDFAKIFFKMYYDDFDSVYGTDEVQITQNGITKAYPVEILPDTRYEPYFLTFINKFGEFQDIVFTGNDSTTLTKTNSSYKGVIKTSSGISALSREMRVYNTQMTSKITLNSGFYPESFNEIFKQLLLSEEVWITYDNDRYAVNIDTSTFTLKKDLINYTIVAEVANPIINYYR